MTSETDRLVAEAVTLQDVIRLSRMPRMRRRLTITVRDAIRYKTCDNMDPFKGSRWAAVYRHLHSWRDWWRRSGKRNLGCLWPDNAPRLWEDDDPLKHYTAALTHAVLKAKVFFLDGVTDDDKEAWRVLGRLHPDKQRKLLDKWIGLAAPRGKKLRDTYLLWGCFDGERPLHHTAERVLANAVKEHALTAARRHATAVANGLRSAKIRRARTTREYRKMRKKQLLSVATKRNRGKKLLAALFAVAENA